MYILALGIISIASAIQLSSSPNVTAAPTLLQFDLSHQFAATYFHPTLSLRAVPTTVYKPSSYEELQHARWRSIHQAQSEPVEWIETQVLGPDVMDRHTLAQLARMAANAYQLPWKDNWYELDPTWNTNASFPFGWDSDEDGFRGFVFRSRDNSTIVLSIKGTALQGPTSKKDKLNDNLLFSCCCARVDISWAFSTVCDCYDWSAFHRRCDDPCLSAALIKDNLFYSAGVRLVNDLRFLFPHANIWLVGHSLGGSLASLLGSTFGLPVVAFQAPGERMAAHRLHLPLPPSPPGLDLPRVPITHVYHNADPIPQGACTGVASPCAQAGYALETRCHLGQTIVYDTVTRLGWHADVRKHPIKELVLNVLDLEGPWPDAQDSIKREVPTPREEVGCVDCFKWEFGHFKHET
ncbi:alpha/beta-hydrolase [Boletus edulis BED1]|uniref:triacylglycerol lipase n=1 Tax=Boletus edulis BED1 TaxID=1328754 RepID=A0AAD4GJJ2_BOLED|nr:alpha/beta-hydrolase [Boletus edulis BED1]